MTSKKLFLHCVRRAFYFMFKNLDKPFMTYDELINLMKSRGIQVDNYTFAIEALQNHSYYTLINGYQHIFDSLCTTKVAFEDIYTLYSLDNSINSTMFKYILLVERGLKSRLSYQVSKKYGVFTDWENLDYDHLTFNNPNDYMYIRNYSNSNSSRLNTLISLKKTFKDRYQSEPLKHYMSTKNHIPPWILCTSITFGKALMWLGILKGEDKADICNSYFKEHSLSIVDQKELLKKSLSLLKEYRNLIAHGNRIFIDQPLSRLPKRALLSIFNSILSPAEYNSGLGQCDTYAIILSLVLLLVDKYSIQNFLIEIYSTLKAYENFEICNTHVFKFLNLPNDILKRLEKLMSSYIMYVV